MTPKPRAMAITLDFALLRGALEEIPFGIATMRGSDVTYANSALERAFGAQPGGLERATLATLFYPEQLEEIERVLGCDRVFDGRIRGKGVDGRAFDAEVHVERYSASAGTGGFLVVRDVTLELSALGRIVDAMGGAMFRFRVDQAPAKPRSGRERTPPRSPLEFVSPSISRLTGLEADACCAHPELLEKFVVAEERDRLAFLYRRLAHGDVSSASAQVTLRRADGTLKLLNLRATGRRDTSGLVRHVEGVVTESAPPVAGPPSSSTTPESDDDRSTSKPPRVRGDLPSDGFASGLMDMAEQLLREADHHHQTLGREVRLLRGAIASERVAANAESGEVRSTYGTDATGRLGRITASAAGAAALTRRVRRALRRAAGHATTTDLLENVRAALAPSFGEAPLSALVAPVARDVVIQRNVDEITLALLHVSLRAFRLVGAGSLRLSASLDEARDVVIEIVARGPGAPPDSEGGDSIPASPLADLTELRDVARSVIEPIGGTFQADLTAGDELRVVVHLPR